jgi:L-amino acid N-acyltransferase YncA
MIRPVRLSDASDICKIYNEYILNTVITFEENPLSIIEMELRIDNITQNYPWFVYEENKTVIGYTYASKWKERSAYRFSVETGIYIDSKHFGKGIGSDLKRELIKILRERSIHTILCGIALPNPASVALCEKFGFIKVGQLKEVGFKLGKWVDVGYWELIL